MLQVPLEIAFHNLESSPAVEEEIRARVSELERRYDRLTSCRVRIDQRNKDLTGAIPPVVHIEMGIPGHGDVVVSHEPDHLLRKYQRPDLHKAINEAFRIAERRLLDIQGAKGRPGKSAGARRRKPVARPDRRGEPGSGFWISPDQGRRAFVFPPQLGPFRGFRPSLPRRRGALQR